MEAGGSAQQRAAQGLRLPRGMCLRGSEECRSAEAVAGLCFGAAGSLSGEALTSPWKVTLHKLSSAETESLDAQTAGNL